MTCFPSITAVGKVATSIGASCVLAASVCAASSVCAFETSSDQEGATANAQATRLVSAMRFRFIFMAVSVPCVDHYIAISVINRLILA